MEPQPHYGQLAAGHHASITGQQMSVEQMQMQQMQQQQQHQLEHMMNHSQIGMGGMGDDDSDDDQGDTRRRGRPRGSKSLCAYIQNDVERRKYFVNRIKAIRAKAETFAKCTGEDILVIAIDENGGAHFWGTPAFERFMNMEGVQDLLYKHLTTQPMANDPNVEAEHLRALLRQKIAVDSTPEGLLMPSFDITAPPPEWPRFTLLMLQNMHQQQQAQAQAQFSQQQHQLAEQQALEQNHMQHQYNMAAHSQAMHHQGDYHGGEPDSKRHKARDDVI